MHLFHFDVLSVLVLADVGVDGRHGLTPSLVEPLLIGCLICIHWDRMVVRFLEVVVDDLSGVAAVE